MNGEPLRLAFVIPWFGRELKGGAEQLCWQLATRLARRGHAVEVFTTCCRSFLDDWGTNQLPEGPEVLDGVTVHRYPVDARDRAAFDHLNAQLLALPRASLYPEIPPLDPAHSAIWTSDNINSRALEDALAERAPDLHAVVFIPYLYGTTLRAISLVGSKAWLQPCLHDECYAYLPEVATAMRDARGVLFNSDGEQALAARLYGPAMWAKGHAIGGAVEFDALERHRDAPLPPAVQGRRFVLFLGRRDMGKGVGLLLEAYAAFRKRMPAGNLALVLAGPGEADFGAPADDVIDLGLVSDEHRVALLRDCAALMVPSANESLSRVMYEAWHAGNPVVVRRSCDATRLPVEASGGGWVAETVDDWAAALEQIEGASASAARLARAGTAGQRYAREHAAWDRVLERFEAALGAEATRGARRGAARVPAAIHQLAPNLVFGDAISNEMLAIRAVLRSAGYRSDIYVRYVDAMMAPEAARFRPDALRPADGLIYHHSIGSEVTAAAIAHTGPKGLVYHNITPPEFVRPYRADFAELLRDGREGMWALAREFRVSAGDSRFNARELERYGFEDPQVLPLAVDPLSWDTPPNIDIMGSVASGRRTIVFVGRVAPNKRQDRLVRAFAHLRRALDARLIIAGSAPAGEPYAERVRSLVRELGLGEDVEIHGHCTQADLHAFYRCADLFWSFSEHEGFCVPLVEAMWFDVPVLALASSAVPETLAAAGIAFSWGEDDVAVASLAERLLVDEALRARVLARQRVRRQDFTPARVAEAVTRFVARITSASHEAVHEPA